MARPRKVDRVTPMNDLICDDRVVHMETVIAARAALPPSETLVSLAGVFDAMGDPTRLRIIAALAERELCVCDLAVTVGLSESAVSHQLKALRTLSLVSARRDGRLVYYSLDDEHVSTLFRQGLDHIAHREQQDGDA